MSLIINYLKFSTAVDLDFFGDLPHPAWQKRKVIGKLSAAKARLNAPRGERDGAYACRTLANVGRLKYAESGARERRG